MKPAGLTFDLRVIRPTAAEDAIWEAVRKAIDEGLTPERFKTEAAQAWEQLLRDDAKRAYEVLEGR